ncbi:MAG: hypothetical protein JNG86_00055 [Verrucomicrobiaceae bacterium]|nr:hypothetical protein [Verrucomicrobiaceae bacterium]
MRRLLTVLLFSTLSAAQAEPKWFKGNTHTHTLWSDGNDFAEMVIDWYKVKGYDFLALSDHNILQAKEVWMDVKAVEKRRKALGKTTLEKYRARFGDEWVITREKDGTTEVRLREMRDYAPKFDEPGKFLLVKAEEISASFNKAPIHMNAVNLQEELQPVKDHVSVQETMRLNLKNVAEQSRRLGVPMFTHINHPNFRWALTAEDLAAVTEENFFEIYNGHPMIEWEGDETRPGHEKLWDIANTLRLTQFHAAPLYGTGTDDSHHYHGEESSPGRGWVMVRAEKLEANALVEAMRRGDFYASSGVTLDDVSFTDGKLRIQIHAEPGVTYTTVIRGTLKGFDATTTDHATPKGDPHPTRKRYSDDVGKTLATLQGPAIEWTPAGGELYFRASITSSKPHPNPSFKGQKEMAWTQPMGWKVEK